MTRLLLIAAALIPSSLVALAAAATPKERLANLRQIGVAIQMYAIDNKGWLPASLGELAISPYIKADGKAVFFDEPPANLDLIASDPEALRKAVNAGPLLWCQPFAKMSQRRRPAEQPVAILPADGKLYVLHLDGHCAIYETSPAPSTQPAR